jgi:amidophosphoribosyltransferase
LQSWREECAVFGIWNHPEASRLAYLGLYALQHRGQEASGIGSVAAEGYLEHKGFGLVADVFQEQDLDRLKGHAAIGHNRYSTTGDNERFNIQPLKAVLFNGPVALAHNGNIVNSHLLRRQLQSQGSIFQGTNDTEILLHLVAKNPSDDLIECLKAELPKLVGAYSMVLMTHNKMVAVRDPYGFRPLVLGKIKHDDGQGTGWVLASETCAFDLIGAEFVREIEPGEIFWCDESGAYTAKFQSVATPRPCVFEYVYFARPDSKVFGKSVYEVRKELGRILARENAVEADMVIPVPDSGVPSALGYSEASGIPFELGIIRNHYVGRTFIEPKQNIRNFGVKIKLNPQSELLKGKRVVLVDDSIVRGTTSRKIVQLVRAFGAKEVHLRIAAPPTVGPCYYGVDTPKKGELIAANQSLEEIRKYIGADSLAYVSQDGLIRASSSENNKTFCSACFTDDYPTKLFDEPLYGTHTSVT